MFKKYAAPTQVEPETKAKNTFFDKINLGGEVSQVTKDLSAEELMDILLPYSNGA